MALLVWPRAVQADTGVPMIAVMWPWAWTAFLPVCIVETFIAKRVLRLRVVQCVKLTVIANAWSTLIGIPLTWLVLFLVELVAGLGIALIQPRPGLASTLLAPIAAPWLGPSISPWYIYGAATFLCIPFMLVSIRVERWSVAKHVPKDDARRWALAANLATYMPMIAVLAAKTIASRLDSP